MNTFTTNDELLDLLTERALGQLSSADEQRLIEQLHTAGLVDASEQTQAELELALAAAMNALASQQGQVDSAPMPERLQQTLMTDADDFFKQADEPKAQSSARVHSIDRPRGQAHDQSNSQTRDPLPGRYRSPFLGWAVAATLAMVIVLTQLPEPTQDAIEPGAARIALLEQSSTEVIEWGASDIPAYNRVTGDVVWNNEQQQGYLRLIGMPANDPNIAQYQLWIVDPARDANPIDGGVFDIPQGNDEIIIPINAKLNVLDPEAFAITREQPGGVVVSDGPLLIVAAG